MFFQKLSCCPSDLLVAVLGLALSGEEVVHNTTQRGGTFVRHYNVKSVEE